ncbi:MAG: hypothetical protein AB7T22_03975 [Calditrichaceae bacterium]
MNIQIIYLAIYLTGRLLFYDMNLIIYPHARLKKRFIIKRILWGMTAIILAVDLSSAMLIFIIHSLMVLIDSLLLPGKTHNAKLFLLLHLFIGLILFPLQLSFMENWLPAMPNKMAEIIFEGLKGSAFHKFTLPDINIDQLLLILTGYVFTLKESTILIRLILNRIQAVPTQKNFPDETDTDEYDRGKLIGNLERTFIYFLIIFDQIAAIAVIIALKSLARFKEMDDKNFAEYFLIGSLLSLFLAALPAVLVLLLF